MLNMPDVPLWTDRPRHLHAMQALSADASLLHFLREPRFRGCVHSVFERVVNVQGEDGGLFTIASRDFDNAPNTLIVDTAGFASTGIDRGDRVDVTGRGIAIDMRIGIRVDGATAWDAALPAYPADDARLRRNLATVRRQIGRSAAGALASPGETPSGFGSGMATALERHAGLLGAALCRRDLEAACAHAQAMVGLGCGLTPSGDDFLVGLFAVLHLPGSPCHALRSVCALAVADMAQRTNAISVAALKAAARGRVRESVQALMGELVAGSPAGLAQALSRVLAIGSTSGADIVAGLVSGFEINLQDQGRAGAAGRS